jgi:site-specific DNA-methyltransferase (adenine-specific)
MLLPREEHSAISSLAGWRHRLRDLEAENWGVLREIGDAPRCHLSERATYILDDAQQFLSLLPPCSLSAVVTDPPYGVEYDQKDHAKLRSGRGGRWRIPPSFDGSNRRPLPRFTVISEQDLAKLRLFFVEFGHRAFRALAPGGHLLIASNPLLSSMTFYALQQSGFEKRGEIIRLVQTLRGGYRPKGAEADFPDVSVMPRACWEPWGIFRKPLGHRWAAKIREW